MDRKLVKLPDNISEDELLKLSKLKHLYFSYMREGLIDSDYKEMEELVSELSYNFSTGISL